jgi:hypothetical protein
MCLAFGRKCWSFDLVDRPETRPEIEPFRWDPERFLWPVNGSKKPDLIFFDPPASPEGEADGGQVLHISTKWRNNTPKTVSLFFPEKNIWNSTKTYGRIAFLIGDWPPARRAYATEEGTSKVFRRWRKIRMRVFFFRTTWTFCDATDGKSHLIDCPLPTERFRPHMVRRMQKNKTLGVVRRSLIVGRKK